MNYRTVKITTESEKLPALEYMLLNHHIQGWIEEDEAAHKSLTFFVSEEEFSDECVEKLKRDPLMPEGAELETGTLPGEIWEHSWKEHIRIQKAGSFVIKPTWETYTQAPGEMVIELDPGMAFGTGDHATTALCLELIDRYVAEGSAVVDFGTGSGILAIASLYKGASCVMAIDHDPMAVAVADENLTRLSLREKVELVTGDVGVPGVGTYDCALGNIFKREVIELISMQCPLLRKGGLFIASGITTDQVEDVERAVADAGWTLVEKRTRDLWGALVAMK
jgi:ribosomal protein L11 methyltransferase